MSRTTRKHRILTGMVLAMLLLTLPTAALAAEPQQDKSAGDGAMEVEGGETLSQMLEMRDAPTLRIQSLGASRISNMSWGMRFAPNMLSGKTAQGVDVSEWQGANDFAAAASDGMEFVIIRCGYGNDDPSQDDRRWLDNIRQAYDNGIPFGVYIYSYATDAAMAKHEAAHVIRQLNAAKASVGITADDITYPVYIDFEDPSQAPLSRSQIHSVINAFAKAVKSDATWGSVDVGFYSFRSWCEDDAKLNTLKTYEVNGRQYGYSRWVAEWGTNKSGAVHALHNNAGAETTPTWYDIWQVCSQEKKVSGIGNGSYADIDFAYKSFPANLEGTMATVAVDTSSREYTGGAHEPKVSVRYGGSNGKVPVQGTDYTVAYDANIDAGTATVTVDGVGKYKGSVKKTFSITPTEISKAEISPILEQHLLGGSAEPDVSVSFNGMQLVKGTDYTLSYSDNVSAGVATVTVTGKGNFRGQTSSSFAISDPDIADAVAVKVPDQMWTGSPLTPNVALSYDGMALARGADYELSYTANVDVGKATVTIIGLGQFAGTSASTEFNIVARDISKADVSDAFIQELPSGDAEPLVLLSYEGQVLEEGTDYACSATQISDGEDLLTITGMGGYSGTREEKALSVADGDAGWEGDISRCAVEDISPMIYTGSQLRPVPVVLAGDEQLVYGRDYIIEYGENLSTGERSGNLTLVGVGQATGKKTVSFAIEPADIGSASASISAATYTGSPIAPELAVGFGRQALALNKDFTVELSSNTNAGTAKATITGKGDFSGTAEVRFPILKRDIAEAAADAIPAQPYTGLPVKPEVRLSFGTRKLSNGDYSVSYVDNTAIGEAVAEVTAAGPNWYGKLSVPFAVIANSEPVYCEDVLGAGRGKIYEVSLAADAAKRVDISENSSKNGANAQIWRGNGTSAQRFSISFSRVSGNRGYYTVKAIGSGKALDVKDNSQVEGANVWQWEPNRTAAQRWNAADDGDGSYYIQNSGSKKLLTAKSASSGANLESRSYDARLLQSFKFSEAEQLVADGTYRLDSAVNRSYAVDIKHASGADRANVQLWKRNGTAAQSFRISYDRTSGYYTITNTGSGKVLDVADARKSDGTNIWQYQSNGTDAQKWSIEKSGDGYIIRSALNGATLDLSGASAADGTNIHIWSANGTAAQKWFLTRL